MVLLNTLGQAQGHRRNKFRRQVGGSARSTKSSGISITPLEKKKPLFRFELPRLNSARAKTA
jgi:hypothetical protein